MFAIINRPKAIENYENLCFKCLKKLEKINKFSIYGRGYGSIFDGFNTHLQLCDICKQEIKEKWFNEEPEIKDYCENYKYENNIKNFINTLPIEGQELFEARCATGSNAYYLKGQDWIDAQLEVLPEWKYEQYNLYAPYRLKVAKERFMLCNEPVNVTWSDGSKGCWCPFGSHGKYGQIAEEWDRPYKCYRCDQFHKRYEKIKEMTYKEYKNYEQIRKAKVLLERNPELNEE